jgi:hypothetical protein
MMACKCPQDICLNLFPEDIKEKVSKLSSLTKESDLLAAGATSPVGQFSSYKLINLDTPAGKMRFSYEPTTKGHYGLRHNFLVE